MPTYKLLYFDARGRAEILRFIFKQVGIEFEDVRLSKEQWADLKPSTPYGSLPVLEVDGKQLAGSLTIQRYLAEEFGLAGSNAWENAQLDAIMGYGQDLVKELLELYFEKDESKKGELKKILEEQTFPKFLRTFEKLLTTNSSDWVFGSKVTYVDLAMYNLFQFVITVVPGILDKYPAIQKNMQAVEALPNIARWLKERPHQKTVPDYSQIY